VLNVQISKDFGVSNPLFSSQTATGERIKIKRLTTNVQMGHKIALGIRKMGRMLENN